MGCCRWFGLGVVLFLYMGCGNPEPGERLTYHSHTKALLDKYCVGCHKEGGLAPFPMDTYASFFRVRKASLHAVKHRTMPPWPASQECSNYSHSLALPEHERKALLQWIEEGAVEGKAIPRTSVTPSASLAENLPRVDATLTLPLYQPKKKPDDYRCFLVKWNQVKDTFITGFRIHPGNPQITHHMAIFLALPRNKEERALYSRLDQEAPGPGYHCFGGPGGRSTLLASWAPGSRVIRYPKGTGLHIPADAIVIVQMHYSTAFVKEPAKATTIELMLEEQVERPSTFTGFTNPEWYHQPEKMLIPAGQALVKHSYSSDFSASLRKKVTLFGILPHLHLRGKSIRLSVVRKSGKQTCLNDVPRWDFNWQFMYFLKQPVVLEPGDRLLLECSWDNSAANQPVLGGKVSPPKDLGWGENTDEEMCVASLYVSCTLPDGSPTLCLRESR